MTEDVNIGRRLGLAGLGAAALLPLAANTALAQSPGGVMDRIVSEKKFKIGYIPSPPSTIHFQPPSACRCQTVEK